ncbi:MAG: hypothetical protein MMC23_009710 [Stictis urceolatum]|nr:hypothetical protein [Stictis urceolata]
MAKTNVPIVFGAMTIGNGAEQSRVSSLTEAGAILDVFTRHGHTEVDTSRFYGSGSSETYLGTLNWQSRGLTMETKIYPSFGKNADSYNWHLTPEHIRKALSMSLSALKTKSVDLYYLHAPDREVPLEETLRGIDELYREGKFRRFGLSNYMAWEVARICEICEREGWVRPTVYQGIYNSLNRTVEAELFACLRFYRIGFYAYNPLGGGFFAGKMRKGEGVEEGSRFDPKKWQGKMYRMRYWNDEYFEAMDLVRPVAEKHRLTLAEVALRWMTHHSLLSKEKGDAVLIGASSVEHLEDNLVDLEKGPLPDEVCKALDQAWAKVKPLTTKYWH